ncbi:MAG: hypothetical protein U1F36_02450 [Planctomycetota bacterium]
MHTFSRTLVLASALVIAAIGSAQAPSNWTTITLPPNLVSGPNQIGTTVTLTTTTDVWFYSGITKRWTVQPVSNPGPVFQANDYCIVQDGNLIHAYASHTGRVDTITTPSSTPTIVSGPSSSSWVTIVVDGTQAWGFGAFHGAWETLGLGQPNPTIVTNRLIGLLRDGSTVHGLSAHHGTFVPVAADPLATPIVIGEAEVGTASSPGVFRAFSAQQNRWGVQTVPATASTYQQNEYALTWDGNQIWGYSGLTGTLTNFVANSPISGVSGAEGVAGFFDGPDVVCYASGSGQFVPRSAPSALFRFEYHFAILDEQGLLTPFSAITGNFGPTIAGSFVISSNDAIAYADAGTNGYAYSPITNTWTPSITANPTSVTLVRDSVVIARPDGYDALSARYSTWVPLTTTLAGNFNAPSSGAIFFALDGAGEIGHVFDARLNRWASVVGQAPLSVNISRHTLMAHDGSTGFGFGLPSGEWYAQPLSAPPSSFRTSSSIGSITHGSQLSVYSVQGSFTYTGRYPEFTQAINLGNTLRLHQTAPQNSILFLLVGLQSARIDFGQSLGHLYMQPATMVSFGWPQTVGATEFAEFPIPMPTDPNLRGARLQLQDLVVPPSPGTPWLSSSVSLVLF